MPEGTPNLPLSYIEAHGDRPALIDGKLPVTFSDLSSLARVAASRLLAQGVERGEVVGVQLPNVWEYPVLELALPLIGAIVMPLPLNLGRAEIEHALTLTGARRILRQPEAEALTAQGEEGPLPRPDADPERIVEVALTSGSTGLPKLASLHAGLKQATFERFTSRLGVTTADRVLVMSPLMQGIGGMCLFCLRAGAALVMLRRPRFDAALLYDALHHSRHANLVLATARKALRPGGRLLLVEPNWKHRFQGRDASDEYGVTEMGYSPRRLKRLLKEAGFTEITRFHNNRKRLFSNRPGEIAAHLAEPFVYRALGLFWTQTWLRATSP